MFNRIQLREDAESIWRSAIAAVDPFTLVNNALSRSPLAEQIRAAGRILVVGGGKAGARMAAGVEAALADCLDRIHGVVNVPADAVGPLQRIRLHAARPASSNHPAPEGVVGSDEILRLVATAEPDDVLLCLLSGGGSALLPAPVEGVSLADKQSVTRLLHASGATIDEMNCVRKHLSRLKGGRLAQAFLGRGQRLVSLILSDVVGDPLDVIASGPTAADPTTFADALAVLERHGLVTLTPKTILTHLQEGRDGKFPETLKTLPAEVSNVVLGNNSLALAAAQQKAESLGHRVLNLGSFLEGETSQAALVLAGLVRAICRDSTPCPAPVCLLSGGETTVTLSPEAGKGGRNLEMTLALAAKLGKEGLRRVVVLCAGSDGEDGPTDAAGAFADANTLDQADKLGLNPAAYLARHDAYSFFAATGDLFKTGLTGTNVMDVRILLIGL